MLSYGTEVHLRKRKFTLLFWDPDMQGSARSIIISSCSSHIRRLNKSHKPTRLSPTDIKMRGLH
jgi:hypothetical protein